VGSFLLSFSVSQVKVQGAGTAVWTDKGDTASTTFKDNNKYSIHIANISTLSNLIHLEGTASAGPNFSGQLSSYQVQIQWGDNAVNTTSTINFVQSGKSYFSGTWSSSPDHNYAAGGSYTITVKLYHEQPPGNESGDAMESFTIQVITITSSPVAGAGFVNVDNRAITTPHTFYWVVGSTHTLTALRPVAGPAGIRYVWTSWSDSKNMTYNSENINLVVPSTATTYTANFMTQYYLTVNNGGHGTAGGAGWYDANTNAQATIAPLTVAGTTGTRYVFNGWTGDVSGSGLPSDNILMNGPKTATATWKTQYRLTMATNFGTTSPSVGDHWYDADTNAQATIAPLTVAGTAGTRYVFNGWTGDASGSGSPSDNILMNGSKTATASWKTQYYLTVTSPHGTTGGENWYDSGDNAYATVTPLTVAGSTGVRYVFTNWSGDASGTTSPSDSITMDGPKTATADWKTQYYSKYVKYVIRL
jgi:uncharacterized repeat protein (TIGR02543 family)